MEEWSHGLRKQYNELKSKIQEVSQQVERNASKSSLQFTLKYTLHVPYQTA